MFPEELWEYFIFPNLMDAPRTLHQFLEVSHRTNFLIKRTFKQQMKNDTVALKYYDVLSQEECLCLEKSQVHNLEDGTFIGQFQKWCYPLNKNYGKQTDFKLYRSKRMPSATTYFEGITFRLPILQTHQYRTNSW